MFYIDRIGSNEQKSISRQCPFNVLNFFPLARFYDCMVIKINKTRNQMDPGQCGQLFAVFFLELFFGDSCTLYFLQHFFNAFSVQGFYSLYEYIIVFIQIPKKKTSVLLSLKNIQHKAKRKMPFLQVVQSIFVRERIPKYHNLSLYLCHMMDIREKRMLGWETVYI